MPLPVSTYPDSVAEAARKRFDREMAQVSDHLLDFAREARTGVPEAVLAAGKSAEQLMAIAETVLAAGRRTLVTRLSAEMAAALTPLGAAFRYEPVSNTAVIGHGETPARTGERVAVVAAGTSDMPVAREAAAALMFFGCAPFLVADVGVAGLWRLLDRIEAIRSARVVIAVAGMEGALFSVLAGLVAAPVIAVPSSVGYGVGEGGRAALSSALASCAPGLVVVNIDNGFGAAAAALKILRAGELSGDRLPAGEDTAETVAVIVPSPLRGEGQGEGASGEGRAANRLSPPDASCSHPP
jgi:NCAIR mutase (PurE)-related protein